MKALMRILSNRFYCLIATSVLAALTPVLARPQETVREVVTGTTKSTVNIGLMYNGDYIYFFGTIPDPSADVIVKLTSTEEETLAVNRKGKVALMWMNVKRFNVKGLPLLYKVHSTRPISRIVNPPLARELGIGYEVLKERMRLEPVRGQAGPDDNDVVFGGILRLKREANLYNIDERRIEITGGTLFKHYFRFPPAAKEGRYRAESYIIKDCKLIGRGVDEVVIHKGGIESAFSRTAYRHPVIYGIVSVIVALGMGLMVGFLFKKGGGH